MDRLPRVTSAAPHLDLADPAFDVTSPAVHGARDDGWYAETPYGWAILRYDEGTALLKDRRFRQGNARWPAQNGIHDGPWQQWWGETLLSLEGDDHLRLKRLLTPAFRSKTIEAMRPRFQALANELIDAFAPRGQVEFVVGVRRALRLAHPLHAARPARRAVAAGGPLGRRPRQVVRGQRAHRPAAHRGGARGAPGYIEEVIAERSANPRDDLVTTLLTAHAETTH